MKLDYKKILPHVLAILVFLMVTWVFFYPLLQGKQIKQGDVINHTGMANEIQQYKKTHDGEPLWTNSMFGGMPSYQISISFSSNLIENTTTFIAKIATGSGGIIFVCFLGFYILLCSLKINPFLSIIASLGFGFSSYFLIIIEAGHINKGYAIGYMAPVIAGILLAYRGRYLIGGALTGVALALELSSNHLQMTYYLLMMIVVLIIIKFIDAIKENKIKQFFIASAILGLFSMLAIGPNISSLWVTYEYGKDSTRGKSELKDEGNNKTDGLDKDYATQWSNGISETFTFIVPNFNGGGSGSIVKQNKSALKKVDTQYKQYIGNVDSYWGNQPFTSGPVYVGALICFLFILGIFVVDGSMKWWLVTITIISIALSWGKNFFPLTEWFLDNMPGYNKFRAVSSILVIAEFAIPLMAAFTLKEIVDNPDFFKVKKRKFFLSLGISAGLCFLFYIIPDAFTEFFKDGEYDEIYKQLTQNNMPADQISAFMDNIVIARKAIFQADAFRSICFILLGAIAIYLFAVKKINSTFFYVSILVLILADMWSVNTRYINKDSYVSKKSMDKPFQQTKADEFILNDKILGYRVLNLSVSTFNDASTSYFHKSIGGYHGAKLKRYQEIIDFQLSKSIQDIVSVFQSSPTDSLIKNVLDKQQVLNMLNAKYVIYNADAPPLINNSVYGAAWFVKKYKIVEDANQEMALIGSISLKDTAIIDKRFLNEVSSAKFNYDTSASIDLIDYAPNHLTYKTKASNEQLAVFSEIYYDKGWNAYIDGVLHPHFRADYILRSMKVPAGEHKIEFKFEPQSYIIGEKISLASSIILILLVLGAVFMEYKNSQSKQEA